jgi:hypothetical protein
MLASDLEMEDVQNIITFYDGLCTYCGAMAETLDHPFPLKNNAPNVPANVLPVCKMCKNVKKNHDVVWMYNNSHLTQKEYLRVIQFMFDQRGGDIIRDQVRRATGMIDE